MPHAIEPSSANFDDIVVENGPNTKRITFNRNNPQFFEPLTARFSNRSNPARSQTIYVQVQSMIHSGERAFWAWVNSDPVHTEVQDILFKVAGNQTLPGYVREVEQLDIEVDDVSEVSGQDDSLLSNGVPNGSNGSNGDHSTHPSNPQLSNGMSNGTS